MANKATYEELEQRVKTLEEEVAHNRYKDLYENAPNAYFSISPVDGSILRCNAAAMRLLGYDKQTIMGMKSWDLYADTPHGKPQARIAFTRFKAGQPIRDLELQMKHKNGHTIWVSLWVEPAKDRQGDVIESKSMVIDITERKQLEAQLQQARKMEAIGRLAGGIAHDFNNMLFAMSGNTEMAMDLIPQGSPARSNMEEVLKATRRARELVKQLLTFSREGSQEFKPVRVQPILKETLQLLSSTFPATIEIRQDIDMECGPVLADAAQINKIIMNLCTNAYHAMQEKGGLLHVTLAQVRMEPGHLPPDLDLKPGTHMKMTVADSGRGMDGALTDRMFEPFFTTKGPGEGTGMGLSVVHGIVKSYGGDIHVDSEFGEGTKIDVFLPLMANRVTFVSEAISSESIPTGNERILLVDDEEPIVRMIQQMLEQLGYHVTPRTSSVEAVAAFRALQETFDIVITDQTMPNMTGETLAKELISIRPDIPIILCMGFSEIITQERAEAAGIREFVMKPVVKREIAQAIRRVLD